MDRELVLAGLMIAAVGATLLVAGPWPRKIDPPASARQWEQASWRALWWPIVPVVVVGSVLVGWAIMEPAESDERLPSSIFIISSVFIGLWVRAAIRACAALRERRPYLAGTVGLWHPRIVLSEDLLNQVDADALAAINAHEAAHVRHRDPLRIWLAQLVTDLQWPWPAARDRFDRWRHVLELARDEEARTLGADGADLAAGVLVAARLQTPSAAAASLIESAIGLQERIARLLAPIPTDDAPGGTTSSLTLFPVSLLGVLSGARFGEVFVQTLVKWLPALLMIVSVTGCGESESAREARALREATPQRVRPDGSIVLSADDVRALGLVVAPSVEDDIPDSGVRFGQVSVPPASEAQVVSPVTGRLAGPPAVGLGTRVSAGQRLLEVVPVLDAAERVSLGTEAAQRQGEIEATERDLTKAEADLARARALAPNIVSAAALQQAETTVATLRARLEALRQARTVQAETQAAPLTVSAPFAGTVVSVDTSVGSLVQRGDVLAQILRPGPLWVDIAVPPDETVGDRYELLTAGGPVPAKLLSRGGITAPDGTRHDRLVVEAPAAATLTPGASVSVRVGHGMARGVVVPESALVPGIDTDTVFVETSNGTFFPRPVRVAARFGRRVRLTSGVKPGERVVVQGAMGLQGELVRAQLQPQE